MPSIDRSREVLMLYNRAHTAARSELPVLNEDDIAVDAQLATKRFCLKRVAAILLCNMDACVRHNAAESKEVYPWLAEMYFGPGRHHDNIDMSPPGVFCSSDCRFF